MQTQKGFVTLASLILSALVGLGGIGAVVFVSSSQANHEALQHQLEAEIDQNQVAGVTIAITPGPTPSVTPTGGLTPTPTVKPDHDQDDLNEAEDEENDEEHEADDDQDHVQIQVQTQNQLNGISVENHLDSEVHSGEED